MSVKMEDFLAGAGITHTRCSLYHPQSNGLVERMNRLLMACVRGAAVSGTSVVDAVRAMLWAHRNTPNADTQLTPFMVLRGRKPADCYVSRG